MLSCHYARNEPEFFTFFYGRREIEDVVSSLPMCLSSEQLTEVKWLVFKNRYMSHELNFSESWRNVHYTELDREAVINIIINVTTANSKMYRVPKWFKDYHEQCPYVDDVISPVFGRMTLSG